MYQNNCQIASMRIVILVIFWICNVACFDGPVAVGQTIPLESGYVNVQEKYGAKGDGLTDDTAAFQQAVKDNVRRLYIPKGIYLFSDTVHFSPKRWILQGDGEEQTILRLKAKSPGFNDESQPKPFVSMFAAFRNPKANMGQAFRSSIFDLTIEVDAGNPGAVAVHYLNNNQGAVRNVTIRSLDPQKSGKAGLAMVTNWPGPALIKNVTIEGFDFGVWSTISQFSLTFEDLKLSGQRVAGIENSGQTIGIRKLISQNRVPALRNKGAGGHIALLESELLGGDETTSAIINAQGGSIYIHDLKTQGYCSALHHEDELIEGDIIEEWSSAPILQLMGKASKPSHLAVEETPEQKMPPVSDWVSISQYGAKPITGKKDVPDCGPAIQKAIDSGARVVYFPSGTWAIKSTVIVRGNVEVITGMDNRIRWLTKNKPAFRIADGTAPVFTMERIDGDYESDCEYQIEHATKRTLVVQHSFIGHYRNSVNGGKVFVNDVCGGNWDFNGQDVWMRQLNPEARGDNFNVRLNNSRLWALGYKTEGPKTALLAKSSRIELMAGFLYANRGTEKDAVAFDLFETQLTANYVNHLGGHYRPQVRAKNKAQEATLELSLDFSNPDDLVFSHRQTLNDETTIDEKMTKRTPKSPLKAFRHGSYGVKVPLLHVEQ
jgi:Pectate lyase superfamily protein